MKHINNTNKATVHLNHARAGVSINVPPGRSEMTDKNIELFGIQALMESGIVLLAEMNDTADPKEKEDALPPGPTEQEMFLRGPSLTADERALLNEPTGLTQQEEIALIRGVPVLKQQEDALRPMNELLSEDAIEKREANKSPRNLMAKESKDKGHSPTQDELSRRAPGVNQDHVKREFAKDQTALNAQGGPGPHTQSDRSVEDSRQAGHNDEKTPGPALKGPSPSQDDKGKTK